MRVTVVDVEIPKEMSQFDKLKTFGRSAGHNERLIASIIHRAAERRKTDLWREGEAKQKQRSTTSSGRTKHRLGEEGANEEMEDKVVDLMSQVQVQLTVQLESCLRDTEAATQCTLCPLRYSAIVTDVPSAGSVYNDSVLLDCDAEGPRERERVLAIRTSATTSSRSGKGGSGEDAETIVDAKGSAWNNGKTVALV